jgi:ferredoxin
MAVPTQKNSENAPGLFYVDAQCIDCDVCRDTAPDHFTRNDEEGYSFVYRQPQTPDEIALCYEALECCPVEAIGDDGA